MIDRFLGEYRFLSNFWPVSVVLDGLRFPSVEHAYQAAKTLNLGKREMIRCQKQPSNARKIGRSLDLRPDWFDVRLSVMEGLVRQKFSYSDLAQMLLSTKGEYIVEGNNWNDKFWGVCGGAGKNHMGLILMKIRSELDNSAEKEEIRSS